MYGEDDTKIDIQVLPAPPGLVMHSKDEAGATWTEPIIGFAAYGKSGFEPLVLVRDGDVQDWTIASRGLQDQHVDGPGFDAPCPWV